MTIVPGDYQPFPEGGCSKETSENIKHEIIAYLGFSKKRLHTTSRFLRPTFGVGRKRKVDDISLPQTTSSDVDVDKNDCNNCEVNESIKLSLLGSSTLNVSVLMHDYTGPVSKISSKVNKCEQTCTVQIKDSSTQTDFPVTCNKKPTVDVGIQCNKPDIAVEDIKGNYYEVQFYRHSNICDTNVNFQYYQ
ncbi:hypothetical protein CHS0354_008787 [Potamilus streckersoni]|uniref:Uncharacterized protein n=1 Tax=Potamilus streckersoni TaxID=2493646 RepID=A0AAE0VZB2_9BIVA|nr:hypothetical protein CHS0354_008787 [Potamilus streckersoni]